MRTEILECTGGDLELLHEIADLFLEDTPPRLVDLLAACAAGDCATAYRAAHTLKGSAGNFGLAEIMDAAVAVERVAKATDVQATHAASMNLVALIESLMDDLRAFA